MIMKIQCKRNEIQDLLASDQGHYSEGKRPIWLHHSMANTEHCVIQNDKKYSFASYQRRAVPHQMQQGLVFFWQKAQVLTEFILSNGRSNLLHQTKLQRKTLASCRRQPTRILPKARPSHVCAIPKRRVPCLSKARYRRQANTYCLAS